MPMWTAESVLAAINVVKSVRQGVLLWWKGGRPNNEDGKREDRKKKIHFEEMV